MKKRHILFALTALVLFISLLLPPLISRISYEQKHTGYVAAIDLNDTAAQFNNNRGALYSALLGYKASGVTTAVLRETIDGGFDTKLLELSTLAGLDTALAVYDGNEKSLTFEKNLRNLFARYKVKYLLLKSAPYEQEILTKSTHTFDFASYIEEHQLILVLCENLNQVSNEKPRCFQSCLTAANGRVMRCYETLSAPGGGEDRIFHQMMNSARDRNTEFLLIHQRTDMADNATENAAATQRAVKSFCNWMQRAGYTPGLAGTLEGYFVNFCTVHAAGMAMMMLMLIFMLYVLLGKSIAWLEWALYALAFATFAVIYIFYPTSIGLLPALFAPFGACFSYTLAFWCIQKLKDRPAYVTCSITILVSLCSLLFCAAVLSSMLSGADYYLNIYIFYGVAYTLILPVLYAGLLLFYTELRKQMHTIKDTCVHLAKKLRWYHGLIVLAGLGVLYFYLLRSGNSNISETEIQIRNTLGEWTLARPRTKEMLIGWPLLVLFALSVKKNSPVLLRCLLGVGSAILFASVMNTFCHVFTDATTSALRTLNGLVFAIPFIVLYTAVSQVCMRCFLKK